jgi:cyclin A
MALSDQLAMRDPQSIAEFAHEIYLSMIENEKDYLIDNDYLKKVQSEIKDTSRGFLVEWIIDVHRKFRLLPETLYVTVSIIDRFLSKQSLKKAQLHMLGVASLLIATKYEEIYPPDLKDLRSISENKFTKEDVLQMEFQILTTLQFDFLVPSSLRFLERYRKLSTTASEDQVFFFAQYLCEISLLDAFLLKHKQSEIAAAAFILSARAIKKVNAWNADMEKWTCYKEKDLKEAIDDVKQFACEVNPKFLSTLKYKFQKPEYLSVAQIPFSF